MAGCWRGRLSVVASPGTPPVVLSAGVSVEAVLAALDALPTRQDVLAAFPGLESDDLCACLAWAAGVAVPESPPYPHAP
jgi:uncharacterized protein (DUF433 family)